ncbi:cytochrome P450 4C1-like [Polistes fuscatus]|uniref:cytochrome P450 4C1-like n=1 Tax=Polistes fuscatus TaxID=30207 RepID=UPI001CA8F830|nr:cytochrome P450 4C1-like [Polistes fuscatus]
MGVNIHAQESSNTDYINHLKIVTSGIIYRVGHPWLISDWMFAMTRIGKQYFKSIEYMRCFSRELIKKRKEARRFKTISDNKTNDFDIKKRKAFLDLLLDINEKDSNSMSDENLREHVDTFIFAGHDSTSSAIAWTLLFLGNELEIQEKVYQEIKDVMEKFDGSIDIQTIFQLKYLERVCKETHRLIPSVCTFSRTITEDIMIDKYVVPKGAILAVHVHGLHHNPKVWTNPEKFDPDRFLIEQFQNKNPYAYVPFSAGPRNCIGQKFANLEQKLVLAMLLQKWIVKSSFSQEDVKKYMVLTVQPLNGLYLYFTPRK